MYTSTANNRTVLEVRRLHPDAVVPERKTAGSVGHDLHSVEHVIVRPRSLSLVGTGIGVRLPYETYARIAPRSGLSLKGIDVLAGVVDPDWTAEIKVVLYNHADTSWEVEVGDRIAQLIVERVALPIVVECVDAREATERGTNGFGSTGA